MQTIEEIDFKEGEFVLSVRVKPQTETVWLNRHQMAQLFERDVKTIGKHIQAALKEELEDSTVAKFETVQIEGNFLEKNGLLFRDGEKVIADQTLVAMVVMIAESKPEEKETMVKLVMNFLDA